MAEAALAELRDSILSGELAPGAPLRLEELAERLGMSISPVREAVRRLESLGLAVHIPHRGARVSELALDDLRDTYEVRLVLEPLAVRRAAGRFTAQDAATARARLADYAGAHERGDARAARAAHRRSTSRSTPRPARTGSCAYPARLGELRALSRDLTAAPQRPAGRARA